MPQSSFALLTNKGRQKEAAALGNGTAVVVTHIAIGDSATVPSGGETALYSEVARKTISGQGVVAGADNVAYADIYLAAADGPYTIREAGLIDADGDLIAIAHYEPPIQKPTPDSGQTVEGTIRLEVAFTDLASVTIKVDPAMAVALQRLSVLPWIPVISVSTPAPPASPLPGDTYVIPTGATGSWATHDQKVAEFTAAGWAIVAPKNGHGVALPDGRVYVRQSDVYVERSRPVASLTQSPWVAVRSIQVAAPPASPAIGDLYLVDPQGASGGWAGRSGQLAEYVGLAAAPGTAGWIFQGPQIGSVVYASDQELPYIKDDNGGWRQFSASESQYGFVILADEAMVEDLTDPARPVVPKHLSRVIKPLRGPQGSAVADNWGDPVNVKPGFAPRLLTGQGTNAPELLTGSAEKYYLSNVQDQGEPSAFFRLALPASVPGGKPVMFSTRDGAGTQSEWIEMIDRRSLDAEFDRRAATSLLFPHVNRLDGLFDFATAAYSVTLQPTVTFTHRGLTIYSLQDYLDEHGAGALTFALAASKTYHIRWYRPGSTEAPAGTWPHGRWMARDVADAAYNPSGYAEAHNNLDGTHDRLLAARAVVDAAGNVTLTRLMNRGMFDLNTVLSVPVSGGPDSYTGTGNLAINLATTPYLYAVPEDVRATYGTAGVEELRVFTPTVNRYNISIYINNFSRLSANPIFRVGYHK